MAKNLLTARPKFTREEFELLAQIVAYYTDNWPPMTAEQLALQKRSKIIRLLRSARVIGKYNYNELEMSSNEFIDRLNDK